MKGTKSGFEICTFVDQRHAEEVKLLWKTVFGYQSAHNAPDTVLAKKLAVGDDLLFVATLDSKVVGTVMAGYDGHRGWIYSLAVLPEFRQRGIGSGLLARAEKALATRGCVKINLQIMEGNETVEAFYLANGYATEKRISMGKRLMQESA